MGVIQNLSIIKRALVATVYAYPKMNLL